MKQDQKNKAVLLRKKGYSYNEIMRECSVSKSTLSIWLRDIKLDNFAKKRIDDQYTKGQLKSQESIKFKTVIKQGIAKELAEKTISKIQNSKEMSRFICGLLYWCEGSKSMPGSLSFTNSDPELIKLFLKNFRNGFEINEQKFRVCVHLHSYHKKDTVLKYWSNVTGIPLGQFIKPYQKTTTDAYKKDGYQGCIRVTYNVVSLFRELLAIRDTIIQKGD